MKTLVKVALIASLGFSGLVAQEITKTQKEGLQGLVMLYGYKCDSVSYASRSSWDGSFRVTCNNNRYVYEVKDVGGRWTVKVK